MWSIYDTCILLTGIFSALIAVIPRPGIPAKTRLTGGAVGLGLIILSFLLGSLSSFRYPSIVFLGPIAALCALLAIGLPDRSEKDAGNETLDPAAKTGSFQPQPTATESQALVDSARSNGSNQDVSTTSAEIDIYPPSASMSPSLAGMPAPSVSSSIPEPGTPDNRAAAWAEAHDPGTSSHRLAELVARHPEFAPTIVSHPNSYQALSDWARTNGLLERS